MLAMYILIFWALGLKYVFLLVSLALYHFMNFGFGKILIVEDNQPVRKEQELCGRTFEYLFNVIPWKIYNSDMQVIYHPCILQYINFKEELTLLILLKIYYVAIILVSEPLQGTCYIVLFILLILLNSQCLTMKLHSAYTLRRAISLLRKRKTWPHIICYLIKC